MNSPSEALKAAIEQFCAPDEETKREGYSKLFERVQSFVYYLLRKASLSESERDDVAAEVMGRLWENRHRTTFTGLSKWWNYVATTTRFCFVDYVRVRLKYKRGDEEAAIGRFEADPENVDLLLEVMENRRAFYRLADDVFLGIPPELSARERDRRLLAAKLVWVDKVSWQTACELLNAGTTEEEVVTRPILDEWLSSRYLLRHLAYDELSWDNARLSCFILEGPKSPEWTKDEAIAIERRYRYAMPLDRIEPFLEGRIKKSELSALFVRCGRRFPFIDIVKRLKRDLIRSPYAKEEIRAPGLWQRLAIQYHLKEGLTYFEILERIESASVEAGYPLNEGKLNSGFGNKRLLKKMSDHLERRDGHAVSSSSR